MSLAKSLSIIGAVTALILSACNKEPPEPVPPNYQYYYDAIMAQDHRALVMPMPQLGLDLAGDPNAVLSIHAEIFYRIDLRKMPASAVTYDANQCTFRIPPPHFRANILFNKTLLTFTGEQKKKMKVTPAILRDYLPEIYHQFEKSVSDEQKEKMTLETEQLAVRYLSKACRVGANNRREAIVTIDPQLYRTAATTPTE